MKVRLKRWLLRWKLLLTVDYGRVFKLNYILCVYLSGKHFNTMLLPPHHQGRAESHYKFSVSSSILQKPESDENSPTSTTTLSAVSRATMMNAWQFESWQTLFSPWKKMKNHSLENKLDGFFSHSNIFLYFKELINFHFFYIFYFVVPQKPFKHPFHLPQAATHTKQITKIIFCLRFFHPPFIHNFLFLVCHDLLISLIIQRRRVWLTIQQHSLIEYLIWFHKYDYTAGGEDERE